MREELDEEEIRRQAFLEYQTTGKMNPIVEQEIAQFHQSQGTGLGIFAKIAAAALVVAMVFLTCYFGWKYIHTRQLLAAGLAIFFAYDLIMALVLMHRWKKKKENEKVEKEKKVK